MDAIPAPVFLILALALLAMAGGLGLWLYNYVTGESADNKKRERPPTTRAAGEMPDTAVTDARELLSVYRMEGDELAVFVQGLRYQHLREIKEPQLGNETVGAIRRVLEFAEGWLPPMRQAPSQPSSTEPAVDEAAFLEQLRQTEMFPLESPPSGLFGQRQPGRRTSFQSPSPLTTPADQINELVQQLMQEREGMTRRNVTVTTGADGGLSIRVDLQTFTEVDSIPDPQVRGLVQDAIREWKES
jgi:hypothetical protein